MAGEVHLETLIASLQPRLHRGEYVFCTVPEASYGDHAGLAPIAAVVESEGLSLVLRRERAEDAGLAYQGIFGLITLQVHSSLEAVGLTAAVASRLADLGISANVVAGYFHDHLLVPHHRTREAATALREMAEEAGR